MDLFAKLYRIIPFESVGILNYLQNMFIYISSENERLKEENEYLHQEIMNLKAELNSVNEKMVSFIERDISHMKTQIRKINRKNEIESLD